MPTTGEISYLKEPGGPGIRVDSALYQGMKVAADYDSLLSKIIAWGEDRQSAIKRLKRGLKEYQIGGLKTDLIFLTQILESHPYQTGMIDTTFLDDFEPKELIPEETLTRYAAVATALHVHNKRKSKELQDNGDINPWRQKAWQEQTNAAS
jgi:acetyl/propionyl-CoA carboxylase alpha subunit